MLYFKHRTRLLFRHVLHFGSTMALGLNRRCYRKGCRVSGREVAPGQPHILRISSSFSSFAMHRQLSWSQSQNFGRYLRKSCVFDHSLLGRNRVKHRRAAGFTRSSFERGVCTHVRADRTTPHSCVAGNNSKIVKNAD